jgi:hypothetical protein
MYKLIKNEITGKTNYVLRIADNAHIPFDPDNTDYQEYLRWLEAGNTPVEASTEVSVPAEENQ